MFKSGEGWSGNTAGCLATQNQQLRSLQLQVGGGEKKKKPDGTCKKKVNVGRRDDANVSVRNEGRGAPAADHLFMSAAHAGIHRELRDPR